MAKIHYSRVKLEEWGGGMAQEIKNRLKECGNNLKKFRSMRYGTRGYNETGEISEFSRKIGGILATKRQKILAPQGDRNTSSFTSMRKRERTITILQGSRMITGTGRRMMKVSRELLHIIFRGLLASTILDYGFTDQTRDSFKYFGVLWVRILSNFVCIFLIGGASYGD